MAVKTWSRTVGNANFSTAGNWNGGTVPVNADSVVYDATSVLDCNIDALGTFNDNLSVNAGYTGVITQSINISIGAVSIADGTWTKTTQTFTTTTFAVSGGVFNGGSGAMTNVGTFTFSGGNVTATSGLWTISAGSLTQTNTPTFNANGGTITFTGGTAATLDAPAITFNIIDFNKTNVNFTVAAGTTAPLGTSPSCDCGSGTFVVNGIVTWTNTLTLGSAMTVASTATVTVSGTIRLSLEGSLTFDPAATITASLPITFTGATTATLTATAYTFATCTLSKTGQLTVAANTTLPLGSNVTSSTASGTGTAALIITGTVTLSGTWTHTGAINVSAATGVVSGALTTLAVTSSLTIATTATFPATIPVTFNGTAAATVTATAYTFGTCVILKTGGGLVIAASTTIPVGSNVTTSTDSGAGLDALVITGTLTISGTWAHTGSITVTAGTGVVSGALTSVSLSGSFTHSTGTFPASIPFAFIGSGTGVITTSYAFPTCTLTKTSTGGLNVASGTTIPFGANPTLTSAGGTLTIVGTVTASGTITTTTDLTISISAGGSLSGGFTVLIVTGGLTVNAAASTLLNGILLTITGGVACAITATASSFGTCTISNKPSGTITVAANTELPLGANPTLTNMAATLICTGEISGSGTLTITGGGNLSASSATSIITGFTDIYSIGASSMTFGASATIPAGLNFTWELTGGEAITFAGASRTDYGFLKILGDTNAATTVNLSGSNTFTYWQDNDPASIAHGWTIAANTTQTFTDAQPLRFRGKPGAIVTIQRSVASTINVTFHATDPAAIINCDYIFLLDITADVPPPTWYAGRHSSGNGDTPNWVFENAPIQAKLQKRAFRIMI